MIQVFAAGAISLIFDTGVHREKSEFISEDGIFQHQFSTGRKCTFTLAK